MRIFIPTIGRGPKKQFTAKALGQSASEFFNLTIVCPPDEQSVFTDAGYTVLPCPAKGISETRQFILEESPDPIVLMLDDDLVSWSVREQIGDVFLGYSKATTFDILAHLKRFQDLMENYAHGAIGHRHFANQREVLCMNSRGLRALAYNRDVLASEGVKFRIKVMEDFDVQLQLLSKGHESVQYNSLVQDQKGSNLPGGCSLYRTDAVQEESAEILRSFHPGLVKVVVKNVKHSGSSSMDWTSRVDVRVQWAKAIKQGKENRNGRS